MKAVIPLLLCLLGAATTATSIQRRQYDDTQDDSPEGDDEWTEPTHWTPKTKDPHFFQLLVDDYCSYQTSDVSTTDVSADPTGTQQASNCPLRNYAIRLEKGSVIATPYSKWWDGPLPTLFVDDDTQMYTVSKEPLQFYVNQVDGALQYCKVGWLPPNSISVGFYHTGNNPLGVLYPSSAFLTWPTTTGSSAIGGNWQLCALGNTKQYKVYVDFNNFSPQGVVIDRGYCPQERLAAVNANPWKKYDQGGQSYGGRHTYTYDDPYA